jgi:hypothetical protein
MFYILILVQAGSRGYSTMALSLRYYLLLMFLSNLETLLVNATLHICYCGIYRQISFHVHVFCNIRYGNFILQDAGFHIHENNTILRACKWH